MKQKPLRVLLCLLLAVLLAAAALSLTGCNKQEPEAPATGTQVPAGAQTTEAPETAEVPETTEAKPIQETRTAMGEGEKAFDFDVTFSNGETACFTIHTDAETVGEALLEQKLIAGDESEWGLYVKTVCDETLDYDADGMYWAFYINGEYAQTGVSQTPIAEGESYAFKAEKG